jgi:hypothetical protein
MGRVERATIARVNLVANAVNRPMRRAQVVNASHGALSSRTSSSQKIAASEAVEDRNSTSPMVGPSAIE